MKKYQRNTEKLLFFEWILVTRYGQHRLNYISFVRLTVRVQRHYCTHRIILYKMYTYPNNIIARIPTLDVMSITHPSYNRRRR